MAKREDGIGLWLTSAIVVGTVIGSGIFLLPASLAPLGKNAIIAWIVSGIGAMCIAFALSRIVRPEGGGLQSYIEAELGPTAGFIVAFALWIASCTGIAAPAIAATAAFSTFVPRLSDPWSVAMIAVAATLALTAVNARGIRASGGVALITIAIRILPLLAVIAVVLMRSAKHQALTPLAATPVTIDTIATAVTLTLFAIIGFEAGTTPVGKVRNPSRTIPLALMAGTAFCVVLYLLSSSSVTLILSPQTTANSLAPYADALRADLGGAAVALAAVAITVAGIGGANTSILCAGELGYSMALRGDLPRHLAQTSPTKPPIISQIVASTFAIALILSNASKSTGQLFIFLSMLATTVTLVVYVLGALAALRCRPSPFATAAIGVSILFSLFAFYGAGLQAGLLGLAFLAIGLAIRSLCHWTTRWRGGSTRPAAASPAAPQGSSS